jgi:hypothetical protein
VQSKLNPKNTTQMLVNNKNTMRKRYFVD